jgi:hypothetical protein
MNKKYFLLIFFLFWSCSNDSTSPPNVDCAGILNGLSYEDECGVCNGDNSSCAEENSFDFSLEDVNPQSLTFGEVIGHSYFDGYIRLYYFTYSDT